MEAEKLVIRANKGKARWFPLINEKIVLAMDNFLKEHDAEVFESWVGYKEDGMGFESLNFIDLLLTVGNGSIMTLSDGAIIEFKEAQEI